MFTINRRGNLFRLNDVDQETLDNALDVAGALLLNNNKIRYQKQVNPQGKRWPGKKKPNGKQTLIDTSSMFRSLTVLTTEQNTRIVTVDPTARNTRTGRRVLDYAKYHQTGTRRMPARPFLGINKGDSDAIAAVFFKLLSDQLLARRQ